MTRIKENIQWIHIDSELPKNNGKQSLYFST